MLLLVTMSGLPDLKSPARDRSRVRRETRSWVQIKTRGIDTELETETNLVIEMGGTA